MKYFCYRCKYSTNDRTKFTRHLIHRKKICPDTTNCDLTKYEIASKYNILIKNYETESKPTFEQEPHKNVCKYCMNCYKNKYTLKRHQINNCSEIKKWYTFVRCLEFVETAKLYSNLRKSLSTEHYNINIDNMHNQLVQYGIKPKFQSKIKSDDNISIDDVLTDEIIEQCEENLYNGIPEIVNKVYLNTNKPNQMIFYHPSIEDDFVIVYHWNYWIKIELYNFFIVILRNILKVLVSIMSDDDECNEQITEIYNFIENGAFNDDVVQMLNIIKTNIHNASYFIEQNIICNICKKSRST